LVFEGLFLSNGSPAFSIKKNKTSNKIILEIYLFIYFGMPLQWFFFHIFISQKCQNFAKN
jgi:hypothetical protein